MRSIRSAAVAVAALSALTLTAACGSDDPEAAASGETTTQTEESPATQEPATEEGDSMDPAATLVGPGCAGYAEQVPDGPGSVAGMAQDPVAVAASNNPVLTTLTSAVSGELNPDVNLVDTLNGDEFTVFAPTDDAFAKIDQATIEKLKTDAELLSTILTYHVVPGQVAPADIAGEQTTVQGGTIEVTGNGDSLEVNGASVVCGGVQTANATVYLIDSVLMPPM